MLDSLRRYEPDQVPRVCDCCRTLSARGAPLSHMSGCGLHSSAQRSMLDSGPCPAPHTPLTSASTTPPSARASRWRSSLFSESTHTAADAAAAVGAELGQIVKSLVFVAPTEHGLEPVVALTSGSNRVDIGRLAAIVGLAGLRRANAQEAGEATGFVIGGIPPVRSCAAVARGDGSRPRPLDHGLGRGRHPQRRLPGAAGDAAHPRQRHRGALRRRVRVAAQLPRGGRPGAVERRPARARERGKPRGPALQRSTTARSRAPASSTRVALRRAIAGSAAAEPAPSRRSARPAAP